MDSNQGVHVFHRFECHPTLLLYRRVHQRYVLLLFERKCARSSLVSFSDVLDAVPIRTHTFHMPELPLLATLEETEDAWLSLAHGCLLRRRRRSRMSEEGGASQV